MARNLTRSHSTQRVNFWIISSNIFSIFQHHEPLPCWPQDAPSFHNSGYIISNLTSICLSASVYAMSHWTAANHCFLWNFTKWWFTKVAGSKLRQSHNCLTHWGRVTHICISKLTIIGSDNGLAPGRHQAIIWTNAGILLVQTLGTKFSEILSEIHIFSFKKMNVKTFVKWWQWPQCVKKPRYMRKNTRICKKFLS